MNKTICYIGIDIGIICIIFSFAAFSGDAAISSGTYTNHSVYGGDAYTGIQNAAADTANNVAKLGSGIEALHSKVSQIGGFLLLILGALITLNYSKQLLEINEAEEENSYTPDNETSPKCCAVCGHTISEGADFCANCGNKVSSVPLEKTPNDNEWKCSKCGLVNPGYTDTCSCGNPKQENE
ncbi:MAG: hypothetical protein IJN40_08655 [Clostridia bacterium]|nr:hypothetical protein [Clostridia bacterium]